VGAVPLGFLAATFGILGWVKGLWSFWLPLLIFSPFIVDASMTLIKRLFRGERVWQAHREHYYQRIVQGGVGHRNTALLEYLLMLMVGGSAVGKQL
jgi:UDP-N-acetylmuramyl pentapeptide phosphotransferase/UDP-N-acetylglucosamine-1-phosphate transferase